MQRRIALIAVACALALAAWVALTSGVERAVRARLAAIGERIGRPVTARDVRALPGHVVVRDVAVAGLGGAAAVDLRYPLWKLLAGRVDAAVRVDGLDVRSDDVTLRAIAARWRRRPAVGGGGHVRLRSIEAAGRVEVAHEATGVVASARARATWRPGEPLHAHLADAEARHPSGAYARAGHVEITAASPLLPTIVAEQGRVHLWRGVDLDGIHGVVEPESDGTVALSFRGGFAGVEGDVWDAAGNVRPRPLAADVTLRADRMSLDRLGALLDRLPFIEPEKAALDGALDLHWKDGALTFDGRGEAWGLTLYHPRIGAAPVDKLSAELTVRGRADPDARSVAIESLRADYGDVTVLADGTLDASAARPRVRAHVAIPRVPCARVLAAIPVALAPALQGFQVAGSFAMDLRGAVDFNDLSTVDLRGTVGIDGCKVLAAPPAASPERLMGPFEQRVTVAPGHEFTFTVGPQNPDYVPLPDVSPYMVKALTTTEDAGFFDHHGFIAHEFRSALARDLREGRFALGASSITMQMVKNVLLTQEKTLARKLQELALTWYVEQTLPKDRILEIYLNVIEFGPGIYGIGRAARHYFGKAPSELGPLEAAFFSSLLPSPKRRYVQYCHGSLSRDWDRYVRRILLRMHARGRISDEEYAASRDRPLVFDRTEALPERECDALVKRLVDATQAPPDEPIEDLDLPFVPGEAEARAAKGADEPLAR